MLGPPQAQRAIILRTRAFGESDRIVTFLTEARGKLTGIAKGARNSRRRFVNCLDPFTLVQVHFRERPTAGLVFMDRCDLLSPPGPLCDPIKFAYGSYLLEVIDQLTVEDAASSDLFELLRDSLDGLRTGPATAGFLRSFELRVLRDCGLTPSTSACHACRAPLTESTCRFEAPTGILLCTSCGAGRGGSIEIAAQTLACLQELQACSPRDAQNLPLTGPTRRESALLLGHWLALHLVRPLKSPALIEALAAG